MSPLGGLMLSGMWRRASEPTVRTSFTSAGVGLICQRTMPSWPHGRLALRRIDGIAALNAVAGALDQDAVGAGPRVGASAWGTAPESTDPRTGPTAYLRTGPSRREAGGRSERLVAALTDHARGDTLLGCLAMTRRLLGGRAGVNGGYGILVDLEVDIDGLHVLTPYRGLGYGHALGAAVATTVVEDTRRLASDLAEARDPASLCVGFAGQSSGAAANAVVQAAVRAARAGTHGVVCAGRSALADVRLTDSEFDYAGRPADAGRTDSQIEVD